MTKPTPLIIHECERFNVDRTLILVGHAFHFHLITHTSLEINTHRESNHIPAKPKQTWCQVVLETKFPTTFFLKKTSVLSRRSIVRPTASLYIIREIFISKTPLDACLVLEEYDSNPLWLHPVANPRVNQPCVHRATFPRNRCAGRHHHSPRISGGVTCPVKSKVK